jgi:excisionase family DNA binding protein
MPQRISCDRVLLSTTEAMQLSGLSREHIQRLLRQKRVEGIKLGHDWLVFEDSLKAFTAQPRKTGPKGPRKKPEQQTTAQPSASQQSEQSQEN